ncbi:hypothetical protein A3A70_00890 [candidate division WWE3 bacterium RIFCSPLOWO2_01_FULL_42_11]|uniref:ComEC/Rec2-related protein domain-containing protein n=1 Tax=candidate division WWE3 bacterium RIFCSPLOWO2_01_FULL_42_11 TaxID=1802627 RepID=A0A1F4VQA7_UNCKA|nr:MAG: hypothetical protein A3A70_00890 [candidate division WWE3 bacterium RIFCSPLOWO2_01_FULL_42_11]
MKTYLEGIAEIRLISLVFIFGILLFQSSLLPYLYQGMALIVFVIIGLSLIGSARGLLLISIFMIGFMLSFMAYRSHVGLQSLLIPGEVFQVTITNKALTRNEWQAVYSLESGKYRFRMYSQYDREIERGDRAEIKISKCKFVEYPGVTYCTGKVTSIISHNTSTLASTRIKLQKWLNKALGDTIGLRPAGLAMGMVLGVRSFVLSSDSKIFQESGLIHILVASGANIIFLTNLVGKIISALKCRIRVKNLSIMLVLFVYAWFIGPEVPIVRAAIMVFFLMLGSLLGRPINQVNGLLLAVTMMLAYNPSFVYNASFQLTVAGVSCIICANQISQWYRFRNLNRYWRLILSEIVIMPLMVILIMGPLLLFRFQSMNIVGVLISPVSLIFVEWLTVLIVPVLLLSWLAGTQIIATIVGITIVRFVNIVELVAELPNLTMSGIRGAHLTVYYLSLWGSASTLTLTSDSLPENDSQNSRLRASLP